MCTPADPSAYEEDILAAKELGFNTLRKHVKVEPDLYYYACDRLGMVVFQDMVNNSDYSFIRDTALPNLGFQKRSDLRLHSDKRERETFIQRMEETVRQLRSYPSILYWTIFNEGWGQFDSQYVCQCFKRLDDSRLIDAASGWFDCGAGDVASVHAYKQKYRFAPNEKPVVLSECGGFSCAVPGHICNTGKNYGYGKYKSVEDLAEAFKRFFKEEIEPAATQGLCGLIYTQLSDVEDELNGLLTYDRRVRKVERT